MGVSSDGFPTTVFPVAIAGAGRRERDVVALFAQFPHHGPAAFDCGDSAAEVDQRIDFFHPEKGNPFLGVNADSHSNLFHDVIPFLAD